MKKKVYRLNDIVINIGEWDFMYSEDELTGKMTVINNPIPDGAVVSVEEVAVLEDGGLTLK